MEIKKYPSMDRISQLRYPQALLGKSIFWTEKRDGSNIRVCMEDGEILISSRNLDHASADFVNAFYRTKEHEAIIQFIKDFTEGTDSFATSFICRPAVFGELLVKGLSPTRIEDHKREEYIVFDIWDRVSEQWLSYSQILQHAIHYGFKVVDCFAVTSHISLESLKKQRDAMLKLCKEEPKREGVVLKVYSGEDSIFVKEKLDTQKLDRIPRKIETGKIQLPTLPESEIYGAIAKAHTDLGDSDFLDKKIAMPLVVKYINEEAKKHICEVKGNLFSYYTLYCSTTVFANQGITAEEAIEGLS